MFRVVEIPDEAKGSLEQLGTKEKDWFRDEGWLFKVGRQQSGDDWSEKVASELCQLLGLPHVTYDLAVWKSKKGVVCRSFVPADGRLVHGNELLAEVVPAYPRKNIIRGSPYTLERVLGIMRNPTFKLPLHWERFDPIETALDVFMGYLLLDAWIANQDRHHENWGSVVLSDGSEHLAPSYDHASSLGSNEKDESRQDRLTTKDKGRAIEWYVQRARSAFAASPVGGELLSTVEAFRTAGHMSPQVADAWLERLRRVSSQDLELIFQQIPEDRITRVAITFAQRMLELNQQRLLRLQGKWT